LAYKGLMTTNAEKSNIKPIAIYLPQFHPIPENDEWWGQGFTEWTNVTKAKPLFKGHYQPHLPADLGYYDLRLPEVMDEQTKLARDNGIYGFCYYHYWFNGKRLLNLPVDNMISRKTSDFPFMICWANENWTRRWDGLDNEILIKQEYSLTDDTDHIRFLLKNVFSDTRYIKVDGKPFFIIYRPQLFPDIQKTLNLWREEALSFGFDGLYLGYMQSFGFKEDPEKFGFDCAIEFQPDFSNLPLSQKPSLKDKIFKKLGIAESAHYYTNIISYRDLVKKALIEKKDIPKNIYKSVTPMWDNSARKKRGAHVFHGSTPELYQEWLENVIALTEASTLPENFVFINAWNEWAEGNYLEPSQHWGKSYLQATKKALEKYA
jgi:lipopolysaccharide biosynthesis protein